MARVKGAMMTRKRRNKILKMAKGYWGSKSKHFRVANQAVMKSLSYAYTGRRLKKRDFRSLWITRISAACKMNGMNYSTFMHGLKVKGIEIKMCIRDRFIGHERHSMPSLFSLNGAIICNSPASFKRNIISFEIISSLVIFFARIDSFLTM